MNQEKEYEVDICAKEIRGRRDLGRKIVCSLWVLISADQTYKRRNKRLTHGVEQSLTTREAGALSFLVISKCYVFNKLGNCNLAWCPVSSVVKLGRKGQARVQWSGSPKDIQEGFGVWPRWHRLLLEEIVEVQKVIEETILLMSVGTWILRWITTLKVQNLLLILIVSEFRIHHVQTCHQWALYMWLGQQC